MKRKLASFTLIELLVVIAIIGILAAIVLINVREAVARARYAKVISDMNQIAKAVSVYKAETGKTPSEVGAGTLPGKYLTGIFKTNTGLPDGTFDDFQQYMTALPTPPCPGWTYDWDSWTPDEYVVGSSYVQDCRNTLRVTLRRGDGTGGVPAPSLYFYCIQFVPKDAADAAVTPYCLGTDAGMTAFNIGPLYPAGGQDIRDLSSKKIYCNE